MAARAAPGDSLADPEEGRASRSRAFLAGEVVAAHGCVLSVWSPFFMERLARQLPPAGRRVVLATNVAESSVTLPGVRVVIDSGLAREPRFEPSSGFSRLEVVSIAQASADQIPARRRSGARSCRR